MRQDDIEAILEKAEVLFIICIAEKHIIITQKLIEAGFSEEL